MPKRRKNELIHCTYFTWRFVCRSSGIWYADGRSNTFNVGRHSLETTDKQEALRALAELDQIQAEAFGLAPRSNNTDSPARPLPIEEGRKLYEDHVARSRVTGGARKSTQKRYRAIFDKFVPFAISCGVKTWNRVDATLLNKYAAYLESQGYAPKTLQCELITIMQAFGWMIKAGHLCGVKPIDLKVRKVNGERAYCYRMEEVQAMIEFCRVHADLHWMADLIIALACTGLRISELASLRWTDLDLKNGRLNLTDETGQPKKTGRSRRELKNGRSRSFPIHADLRAVIDRLSRTDAYLFHGPRGGRIKPDTTRNILVRDVIGPLKAKFPKRGDEKSFEDGRQHSFRHYFCSTCANNNVPERMVMEWLGHTDSAMVRHYYHLHDDESRRRMAGLNFLGEAGGRSDSGSESVS